VSEGLTTGQLILILGGAALLLLIELSLSISLVAVTTLSRVALHRVTLETDGRLEFFEEMHRPPSTYRSATVVLRQLSLLGAALLLTLFASGSGWPRPVLIGPALAFVLGVVFLEVLVGRALALWRPRAALRATAPLVRAARLILFPLVGSLIYVQGFIERAPNGSDEKREEEQEEEAEALIEVGEREGLLEAEEGAMMRGIIDLDETIVREIMTPRTNIVALPIESTVGQARRHMIDSGHSRVPVYRGSIDNVVGNLHARDLMRAWEEQREDRSVSAYMRPATFVPETLSAAELLREMRLKTQIALVVDEYGGTAGLVTLEDLLEEIVGEIRDEHEQGEPELVAKEADGSYRVHAVAHVDELETLFGVEFENRDFDTVGGLVVSTFGRVPKAGEHVTVQGLRLEVLQADRRRILMVRVRRAEVPGDAQAGR